jgi:hypothetical protein
MILSEQIFYTNSNISKQDKIELEQRRRNQIYKNFDYILSSITYFDFFSLDAFNITKKAKKIAHYYQKENVNNEILLISFIYSNTQISKLLEEYGLNKNNLEFFFIDINKKTKTSNIFFFQNYLNNNKVSSKIDFSHEINLLFEKASENALTRFKTPVISSEILFLTFLEQKNNKIVKILKKIIGNELNWQLFRYKILKRIHKEESSIREEISKNKYYFAYLLKTQLKDYEFDRLLVYEFLIKGVSLFRNTLISKLLELNIEKILTEDIHKSIKITNKRIYSN